MKTVLPIVLVGIVVISTVNLAPTTLPQVRILSRSGFPEPSNKRSKLDLGPRCKLLLSEFKLCSTSSDESCLPFIELKSECVKRPGPIPKNRLREYKMLIVNKNPFSVVFFLDFENYEFEIRKNYIVIGSPLLPSTDVSLSSPDLQSLFSRTKHNQMLPAPTENSYAVFLLSDMTKNEAKTFHIPVDADLSMKPRILTTAQIKFLETRVVDMMVLGSDEEEQLSDFRHFWKYSANSISSSVWGAFLDPALEKSISICNANYMGFDASALQVTIASPGLPNSCFQQSINVEDLSCNAVESSKDEIIHPVNNEEIQIYRDHSFDFTWIESCQEYFPKRERILEKQSVQSWIHFEMLPTKCKFTCIACKFYLSHGFRPDIKNKQRITTTGFLNKDIYVNNEAIKNHERSNLHMESLEFSSRFKQLPMGGDNLQSAIIIQDFESKEKQLFNATMNVVLFVYAEMKAGIAFQTHDTLMKALRLTGANFGWLQHTNDAAQSITKVISQTMHNKLLQHLTKNQEPFSIMVDSSTNHNQAFLAVYIQTIENNSPFTHFYSLIHMSEGEKSKPMTDSLVNQIQKDNEEVPGFEEFFKSKLTAIVTDGASVMVGDKMSFKVYVREYIQRKIPNIVCMAHRLDSAYKLGIKPDKNKINHLDDEDAYESAQKWQYSYFQSFEKSTNEFYAFYASRGHKKWLHLLNTAEDLGVVPRTFKYIFPVRWSESHFVALETILHNYFAIIEDLEQMTHDTDFKDSAEKINRMYQQMTDKTYMIVLHEFLDILTTYKVASKKFQESSSILVGKINTVYNIFKTLKNYMAEPGPFVQRFLSNCICDESWHEEDTPLQEYDHCEEIIINGVRLVHQYPVVLPYYDVRNELYQNLISSLRTYFNMELLESFEIFNPERLKFQSEEMVEEDFQDLENLYQRDDLTSEYWVHANMNDRVEFLCQYYFMETDHCGDLIHEWTLVLGCVVSTKALFPEITDVFRFWTTALRHCESDWTPLTKKLLGKVLVTPYSSSECERGFSVLNSIRTKSRSRLDKNTVDAIMRVKINGPEVEDFNSYLYTIEFLKSHVRADDVDARNGKELRVENTCNNPKFLNIY